MLVDDFRDEILAEIKAGKIEYATLQKYKALGIDKDTMYSGRTI